MHTRQVNSDNATTAIMRMALARRRRIEREFPSFYAAEMESASRACSAGRARVHLIDVNREQRPMNHVRTGRVFG